VLHSHHSLVEKYNLKGKHLSFSNQLRNNNSSANINEISENKKLKSHADSADKRRNNNLTSANISEISVQQLNTNESNNYISTSFHSLEEIKQNSKNYEYAFLSPVFDSISKQGYKSTFDKTTLKTQLTELNKNVEIIALGGIDENNIQQAMELGFDGVAVLGAVWQSENPIEKFKKLAAVCNSVNTIKKEFHV
jgi:thiamine-phosphate pyrophosphorylase